MAGVATARLAHVTGADRASRPLKLSTCADADRERRFKRFNTEGRLLTN
jgi:hypothetical protein